MKISSIFVNSLKSESDDGLSSWLNFPEGPTPEALEMYSPVIREIEPLRGKITVEQLEIIKDVLATTQDVTGRGRGADPT